MQCCSSPHRTLLPSPVTSTAGWCFCFGSVSAFFLGLLLHIWGVDWINRCTTLFAIYHWLTTWAGNSLPTLPNTLHSFFSPSFSLTFSFTDHYLEVSEMMLDIYPGMKLPDHMVDLFFVLCRTSVLFSLMAVPTRYKDSFFSTSLPTCVICCLFDNNLADKCEVIPYCSFDLHFSNN